MNICKQCNSNIPNWMMIEGKNRNLSSRQFCLTCSPFGQHNTINLLKHSKKSNEKWCPKCKQFKPSTIEHFYKSSSYCRPCVLKDTITRQTKQKQKAVDYKGGKCEFCGYHKCLAALEFHHKDPTKKDFGISRSPIYDFEQLKKELDKCLLLCCLCHRELHAGIVPAGVEPAIYTNLVFSSL